MLSYVHLGGNQPQSDPRKERVKNDGNGGRKRIIRGNPAMRIDYIHIEQIINGLLSLHIEYNIGLVYI